MRRTPGFKLIPTFSINTSHLRSMIIKLAACAIKTGPDSSRLSHRVLFDPPKTDDSRRINYGLALDRQPAPLSLAHMGLDIYSDYQRALAYRGAVDFDDLIRLAYEMLDTSDELLERLRYRWPYILEDEAQDSSDIQQAILGMLAGEFWAIGCDCRVIQTKPSLKPSPPPTLNFCAPSFEITKIFLCPSLDAVNHPLSILQII